MAELPYVHTFTVELRVDPVLTAQQAGMTDFTGLAELVERTAVRALANLDGLHVDSAIVTRREVTSA